MDLLTDVQKSYSSGDTAAASMKILKGLGQMASGKYEGASRQLETVYKDPADIKMAEEIKTEFNNQLKEYLNVRKFLAGSPEALDEAAYYIVANRNLDKGEGFIDSTIEYFTEKGLHFERAAFEQEIKRYMAQKEVLFILSTRDAVDKYVFIDRMTADKILEIPALSIQQYKDHQIFK